MSATSSQSQTQAADKAASPAIGLRESRNRHQWMSIAKFLQEQKPSPKFKRKPVTAAERARALVKSFLHAGAQA